MRRILRLRGLLRYLWRIRIATYLINVVLRRGSSPGSSAMTWWLIRSSWRTLSFSHPCFAVSRCLSEIGIQSNGMAGRILVASKEEILGGASLPDREPTHMGGVFEDAAFDLVLE